MTNKNGFSKWWILTLATFFYFYDYLVRISPSVMVPELMSSFHTNATLLGLLISFYFYSYAPMQLPVGLLVDRFGVKKPLIFGTVICGIGSIIFGVSFHFFEASIGRLLLGLGSSFAFVSLIYVSSHWFPKSKRALIVGLANSIGMLGAFCAQGPLSIALYKTNWRVIMALMGIFGFLLAFLIHLFVKIDNSHPIPIKVFGTIFKNLKSICKSGYTWINALIILFVYVAIAAVADLWGVPFLKCAYHLNQETAAFAISMIFLGTLAGGPVIGFLSDRLKKRKKIISICIIFIFFILITLVYFTNTPLLALYILLFFMGFFSVTQLLGFVLAIELNSTENKASAVAFTNTIVSSGGIFIHPLVGFFLDITWNGLKENGVNIYSIQDYQRAFLILPVFLCLAFILCLFLKEPVHKDHVIDALSID